MEELKQIAKVLEITETATLEEIIKAIENLKNKADEAQKQQNSMANSMITKAISLGALQATQKQDFLNLFSANFESAKNTLQSIIDKASNEPTKTEVLNSFMKGIGANTAINTQSKPKGQWTLNDYRKHAPNELKANPQLYKQLIQQEYGMDS